MTETALMIDEKSRWVSWRVALTPAHQREVSPWGEMWRGEESGAGLEVWVEASASFDLLMQHGPTSYFEAITPGRHRFLLTVLDSTDVARDA